MEQIQRISIKLKNLDFHHFREINIRQILGDFEKSSTIDEVRKLISEVNKFKNNFYINK